MEGGGGGAGGAQVVAWDEGGQQVGPPQQLKDCYVVAMDFDPRSATLLVGGAAFRV